MEYALIKNNLVINTIVADETFVADIAPNWDHIEPLDTAVELNLAVGVGWGWDGTQFIPPTPAPAPAPSPLPSYSNFIDIGPFFDRFGSQKLPVLISQDQTVQALLKDIQIRKWIDLSLPEVQQSVQYLASIIPGITPLIPSILATPVQAHENLALRKLYFS